MTAFLIANFTILDAERMQDYAEAAGPTLTAHGGEFVFKGALAETLLGQRSGPNVAVVRFPSLDAAQSWYHSPEYKALTDLRASAAQMEFALFEAA
ncbi:MAG: DUF1330 domain-containing protein [Pseudomonadota bacterium]